MSYIKKSIYVSLALLIVIACVYSVKISYACSAKARTCNAWCETAFNCGGNEKCTNEANFAFCRCGGVGAYFYCNGSWAYAEYNPVSPHPSPVED